MNRALRGVSSCFVLIAAMLFAGCNSGSKPISVTVVSPSGAQAIDIGQTFNISVQVNNDKMNKGATFSLSGVGTLGNQSATGATYTAPTSGSGGNAMITIASATDPTKTIALNVVVAALPTITNASPTLAAAIQGVAYAGASITVTGGASTLTYSITAGALPTGLALSSSTGAISGTATAAPGTYNFTVQVKDSSTVSPQTSSKAFSITVNQQPTITSANSAAFTVNTPGTFTVTTTAAPTAALSETGPLPTGVSFVDNGNGTATIAGTATTTGNFPITITASNGIGTNATQNFTLTIGQAPGITSAAATTFTVGSAGSFTVNTSGFPTPSLSETGALPAGVTFVDQGNGTAKLSGTPAANTGGTYPITIKAHNGIGADATQNFTLTVDQAPAITSANSASFTINTPGTFTVTTTGFPKSALSETGALPTGVTFVDKGNGTATLAGTPTVAGSFAITITANNGVAPNGTQNFTLTVGQAPAITSGASTTFTVGSAGSFTVNTSGFPAPSLTETGALPGGVTFVDNGNGTAKLSGTPAAGSGGTYNISFKAHNGFGSDATQNFTLTIDQAPAITSATSATFSVGAAGSFTVTTSGFPTAALTETGALPTGVTFVDNGNGKATISGIATAQGSFPITITANNGVAPNGTQAFTLTVNTAPAFTSANNTTFTVGTAGSFSVSATGTPTPSFSESGALPGGVTFADNHNGSATLSGTPAANTGGTYNFTITATNTAGSTNQSFTLTVDQAPAVTSPSATTFTEGSSSSFTVTTSGVPKPALSETGALPNGVTFVDNGNGTATLSGTPAGGTAGSYPITITANNGVLPNGTQAFTLTVNTLPVFGSASNTTFTVGTAGSFAVSASGSPSFSVTGTLPSGVTLTDNHNGTATLGGTPAAGTGGVYNFSIKATNGTGTTSQGFTLTVDEAPGFTSANTATFSLGVNGSFTVTTTGFPADPITESGALPTGVTFVDNGNNTATLSGTPAAGTAGNYPITLTASNGIGSNATQNFTLIVVLDPCAGATTGGESLLNGHYAFLLKGYDNQATPEPVLLGGVLTLNGSGSISSGTLDANTSTSNGVLSQAITGGTYKVDSTTHRACFDVITGAGTSHYRASLGNISAGVASLGHMIGFDTSGPFVAGVLKKQTTTAFGTGAAQVSGNYAFGVASPQNSNNCNMVAGANVCGGGFGALGVVTLSAGTVTGGEVDFSVNGQIDGSAANTNWPGSPVSISSGGTYTVSSTTGRGTFIFTPNVLGGANPVNSVIYVVSPTEFLILNSDNQTNNSLFAGEALQQSGEPFSTTPLSGAYVGYQSDLSVGGARTTLLLINASGSNLSGNQLRNDSVNGFQQKPINTITYTVSSQGRMTLPGNNTGPIFYVVSPNRVFILEGNNGGAQSTVGTGLFQSQTSTSSPSGTYAFGNTDPEESNTSVSAGIAAFASPNINLTQDDDSSGSQNAGQIQMVTFSIDSTGLGVIPSGCSVTVVPTTCQTVFYTISPTQAVVMDASSNNPKITLADK